ncbi:glycosyl transferase family 2, partial [Rhizobium sp. PP-CC-3A-592]
MPFDNASCQRMAQRGGHFPVGHIKRRTADMNIDNLFIGLITFRRPKGLRRALEGIAALTFETTPPPITVIVVDNDRDGLMAGLIEEMRPSFPFPITYAVHSEPGIPFARNRVVAETKGADGVILFIDDDEYPEPEWADQLLAK